MSDDATPIIRVENLLFEYGEGGFRLEIPDLIVEPGETVAVVGPSGSGKTTLLSLVSGVSVPKKGRVITCGQEISGMDEAARRAFRSANIGLVFQEFELLEYLDVLDNILLPYRIAPALTLTTEVRERAEELAGQVEIGDKLRRRPGQLSQGERQRVALCRALLVQPGLVLADEPTGNLDVENKNRVLDLLFENVKRAGATLLMVTHDRDLLNRFGQVVDFKAFQGTAV